MQQLRTSVLAKTVTPPLYIPRRKLVGTTRRTFLRGAIAAPSLIVARKSLAWVHGASGAVDPWTNLDGRLNAGVSGFTLSTLLNNYTGGGIVTANRYRWPTNHIWPSSGNFIQPQWMVSGVDYPVGPRISRGSMANPSTISIAGVTVDNVAQQITITGNNVTLTGYDFSLNSGWVYFVQPGANATLQDCYFKVTGNFASGFFSSIGINDTVPASGNATGTVIQYCEIDRQGLPGQNGADWGGHGVTCPFSNNGAGTTIIQYCYIHDAWGQCMTCGSLVGNETFIYRWNIFRNGGDGASQGAHGDFLQNFQPDVGSNPASYANMNLESVTFNLFLQDQNNAVTGAANQPITMNGMGGLMNEWDINNNTIIVPSTANMNYTTCFIDYTHVKNAINVKTNFIDPSGATGGGTPDTSNFFINNTGVNTNGVVGTQNPTMTVSGNVSMADGTTLM